MLLPIKNILAFGFIALLACNASGKALSQDFEAARKQVLALKQLTKAPRAYPAEGFESDDGIKAIYFDALPWKGKPTRVFAWIGLPENVDGTDARKRKLPGVVLVQGGGGTAFKEWVKKWNEQGFVAISIAVEGQTDRRPPGGPDRKKGVFWERHPWGGPARTGIYGDSNQLLADQWMYHAVADTVLANSLLRSLPEVDASKVGVMGISWGGVIASTVIGIDNRFAFGIPTYGCGDLADVPNQYGRALGQNLVYRNVWDPMLRMRLARLPTLWLSWTGDQHFPLDSLRNCYDTAKGPHMVALLPNMRHGHGPGWNPPDSYAFARSVVETGQPWCRQLDVKVKKDIATINFTSSKEINSALMTFTSDTGFTGKRNWQESAATFNQDKDNVVVTTKIPAGTTAWFVNLKCGDLIASSDFQEVTKVTTAKRIKRKASDLTPDDMWTYKQVEGKDLQLSVFLPEGYEAGESDKTFPTIVFFHGGSWTTGEPNWHFPDCEYWSRRGMIAVSVDYRLKDRDNVEVPLECVKDAKSAIRFLRKNAERLKVNPNAIVAAGGSAGGQLAAGLALITGIKTNDSNDDASVSCEPNAVVLFNPYFKCKRELSPPTFIGKGLPPTITFLGDEDSAISVDEMKTFHESLTAHENVSALYVGKGGKHGFCNGRTPVNPFFYWSLELTDRFLVQQGILSGPPMVELPAGVKQLQANDFLAFVGDLKSDSKLGSQPTEMERPVLPVSPQVAAVLDKNKDGKISKVEFVAIRSPEFDRIDKNNDTFLTPGEFAHPSFKRGDANKDGKLTRDEFISIFEGFFQQLDKDKDGELTSKDTKQ